MKIKLITHFEEVTAVLDYISELLEEFDSHILSVDKISTKDTVLNIRLYKSPLEQEVAYIKKIIEENKSIISFDISSDR